MDPEFGLPTLSTVSQCAEKLPANADRGLDKAVAYRDAIDLGMLVASTGHLSGDAVRRAETAYGEAALRSVQNVMERLADRCEASKAAAALQMDPGEFDMAARNLREAATARWPQGEFAELPSPEKTCSR